MRAQAAAMSGFSNRAGVPIDGKEWAAIWGRDHTVVQQDLLPNGYYVSTVWDGVERPRHDGPPLIFESMVFRKGAWHAPVATAYWSTEREARAGHAALVQEWSSTP